jgi:hypothetical protein
LSGIQQQQTEIMTKAWREDLAIITTSFIDSSIIMIVATGGISL